MEAHRWRASNDINIVHCNLVELKKLARILNNGTSTALCTVAQELRSAEVLSSVLLGLLGIHSGQVGADFNKVRDVVCYDSVASIPPLEKIWCLCSSLLSPYLLIPG